MIIKCLLDKFYLASTQNQILTSIKHGRNRYLILLKKQIANDSVRQTDYDNYIYGMTAPFCGFSHYRYTCSYNHLLKYNPRSSYHSMTFNG
jgi:hypothetical protein